jgi:hypothetical protein
MPAAAGSAETRITGRGSGPPSRWGGKRRTGDDEYPDDEGVAGSDLFESSRKGCVYGTSDADADRSDAPAGGSGSAAPREGPGEAPHTPDAGPRRW